MAVSVFMRYRSGRDAVMLYESIIGEMRLRGQAVREGLLYHLAAVVPNGMFIADTWESRDAFSIFAAAKTIPLTERRGLTSPEVEFADVYGVTSGAGSSAHGCGIVSHFNGDPDDLTLRYEAATEESGFANVPPPGLIMHWSAKRPTGICTVDHWLTTADCETFRSGAFDDALRSAGIPAGRVEIFEVYNTIDGRRMNNPQPA